MKKILVVDDETGVREMFYEYLSRIGYKVMSAPGGREAIAIIEQFQPDIVLMDLKMPGMDGIGVLRELRSRRIRSRVVMLTGMDSADLEREARNNGAAGFIKKQLGLPVIARAVDAVFRDGTPADPAERRIMVVDDNAEMRGLLERFLRKKGYSFLGVATGEEALTHLGREKWKMILLDISLPGMDGLMTLKRIREIDSETAVIMITGCNDGNIAEDAMKLGAYDYIVKPFDLDYLEMCLAVKIALIAA